MIIVKCEHCHHEAQAMKEGDLCSWCKKSQMVKIGTCPDFDPYAFLGKLGRIKP
jgi:hypothetical protein